MVQEKQIGNYTYSTGIERGSKKKLSSSRTRLLNLFNNSFQHTYMERGLLCMCRQQ